ncbi:ADP-ribosyl cyclase/cyclic ADP-ribose hydrolase 1 [Ictidomys tridecemlineatus]|uniref:ADP-ribosyl cyclase/cyclic ADP-ribose hydrolase 1 n=1 Tax=Ictidomys tridecemlineatus TaxID=43179 RepID=I3M660_ICTTR|nr:ADP-ribosyl cyclase/cyclic ADP-ribose hydrolase 1 [Ictidomys tridecemlineatus]KAG3276877.1 CD38 molecule [Ictidomys tridecemlineatus]
MSSYEFSPVRSGEEPCCRISKKALIGSGVGLLVVSLAVVVAVVVLKVRSPPELLEWHGRGTTSHFSEIVLGRCFTYTQLIRPELRDQDCRKILDAFKSAFLSKNPCNITKEDYQPLLKLDTQTIACNKTLFWSKLKDLAHQYTGVQQELVTLEDTLLGYMADRLTWCGDPSTSDLNYQSCPHWRNDCSNNPGSVFWKAISQKFAEAACGVVQVMLNGSLTEPFDKNSIFGSVEIFNLRPEKVHTVQVWVMQDIGKGPSDSCSGSSLNELKLIVNKRNMTFVCQNNYRPARFVQCVKNPEHPSCRSKI